MQVTIVVAAHGKAAGEIIKSAQLFVGDLKSAYAVDFVPGENTDTIYNKFLKIREKEQNSKILFLVDTWGGSPFNAANRIAINDKDVEIVTGVNIPMLIEVFMALDEPQSLESLAQIAVSSATSSIRALKTQINDQGEQKEKSCCKENKEEKTSCCKEKQEPSKTASDVIETADQGPHLTIALARIDDRLIHGQVVTSWAKETRISRIIVVNDQVAADPIRVQLLKQVVPPGITGHVITVAKASRVYNNTQYAGQRVMLLFTNPGDVLKLIKAGFQISSVNVGGMAYHEGRTSITKAISVTKQEADDLREIQKLGIELDTRMVVNSSRIDLIAALDEKNI